VFPQLSYEHTFEKIEAHFISEFFHVTLKNSYSDFEVEIKKTAPDEQCPTNGGLSHILEKDSTYRRNGSP
jgi:hypothetical protein